MLKFKKKEIKDSKLFSLLFQYFNSLLVHFESLYPFLKQSHLLQTELNDLNEQEVFLTSTKIDCEEKIILFLKNLENTQIILSTKLKSLEKKKQNLIRLMKLFKNLKKVLNFFIEQKISVSQEPTFIDNMSLYLSIRLIICFKQPSKYRIPLIQALNKLIDFGIDLIKVPLYEILFDQSYVYDIMEFNLPSNRLFLESLCTIEFLLEQNIFFVKVIDTSGFFRKFMVEKYKKSLIFESWTKNKDTDTNIEKALVTGGLLVIEEWDEALLKSVEPILEWKVKGVNREISQFFVKKEEGGGRCEAEKEISWNEISFNGKKLIVHKKFKLCMILKRESQISNDMKYKVFLSFSNYNFFYIYLYYFVIFLS